MTFSEGAKVTMELQARNRAAHQILGFQEFLADLRKDERDAGVAYDDIDEMNPNDDQFEVASSLRKLLFSCVLIPG